MPKSVNKLEKKELLGSGGFAHTYRAIVLDPELRREWNCDEVAIKIPLTEEKEKILKKELKVFIALSELLSPNDELNIVRS